MSDPRVRVSIGDIQTRFTKGTLAGYGVLYLRSDEIDARTGLGLAIGSLFGPLQAALEGGDSTDIEVLIQKAERTCQAYWEMARNTSGQGCSVFPERMDNPLNGPVLTDEMIELNEEML